MERSLITRLSAEFLGTFLLVFFAVGTAVFGANRMGDLGVALAFGFVLLALAYTFGSVSGCHVNPAVTMGMLVARRLDAVTGAMYMAAQIAGGIVGAALIKFVVEQNVTDQTGALGTNGFDNEAFPITVLGAFVVEVVLTALLVIVVLNVTRSELVPAGFAGLPIGIALAVIHLAGIPLTGTSVNPARSIGPALFEGGDALSQLWLFIVAPLVGGLLAALIAPFVSRAQAPVAEADAA
jgi:aquaporin Z